MVEVVESVEVLEVANTKRCIGVFDGIDEDSWRVVGKAGQSDEATLVHQIPHDREGEFHGPKDVRKGMVFLASIVIIIGRGIFFKIIVKSPAVTTHLRSRWGRVFGTVNLSEGRLMVGRINTLWCKVK